MCFTRATMAPSLVAVMEGDALVAHMWKGALGALEDGGPARLIILKSYSWKGALWANDITFLDRISSSSRKCEGTPPPPTRGPGDQAPINTTHTIAKTAIPVVRHRKTMSIGARFFMPPNHSNLSAI